MPIVYVKGRPEGLTGNIQVAADADDVSLAIPANVTMVNIYTQYPWEFWVSFDGALNSWERKFYHKNRGECLIPIPSGKTTIYFRKPMMPRSNANLKQPDPALATLYAGNTMLQYSSDTIAALDVEFRQ